jgi:hypothetical protein
MTLYYTLVLRQNYQIEGKNKIRFSYLLSCQEIFIINTILIVINVNNTFQDQDIYSYLIN